MAYDRQQILLRVSGHFGTSANQLDHWSTGIRLAVVGGGDITASDFTGFLESVSAPIATFHNHASVSAGNACFLTKLTAARIGINGKYVSKAEPTQERPYAPPVAGQSPTVQPWTAALVIGLRTLNKRGLASNGRLYWPATGQAVVPATGQLGAGTVDAYLQRAKDMITGINTAAQALQNGLRVHVMSQGSSVGPAIPAASIVTAVRTDGRFDHIERRENDQQPTYQTVTLL